MYRSPNIGIFLKANDKTILIPRGMAPTKAHKIESLLGVKSVRTSIGGLRLLGPLVAMNGKGIVVSRLAEDEEMKHIKEATGLPVERIPSKYTSIGNLVAANDKGAVVSTIFEREAVMRISDVLDVPVEVMEIASYVQVGSVVIATNLGGAIHPHANEEEVRRVSEVLRVDVEPATVNGGVPFVASGIVVNSQAAVVGSLTRGPELAILSRAFQV